MPVWVTFNELPTLPTLKNTGQAVFENIPDRNVAEDRFSKLAVDRAHEENIEISLIEARDLEDLRKNWGRFFRKPQ